MNELFKKFFAPGVSSEQWSLNKWDYVKATVLAIFAAPISMLVNSITQWSSGHDPFVIDWQLLWKSCVIALTTYLVKNYFSPSANPPLK